ncbi:MAG: ABC transporter ATP-binding protein [bacterium]
MNAIKMKNITKKFGEVVANDKVNLRVKKGEIHSILGENGAGKSTLMKILFGLYSKDGGEIFIEDKKVEITSPVKAIKLGIGMIHQHFMLVNRLSVTENIIAGKEPITNNIFINKKIARKKVKELAESYNFKINPEAKIEDLSVGEQQRVEILKALYRDAEILILDEPTAVLTPQEVEEFFEVLNKLKKVGKTIIFITHKLEETMKISDSITILRDAKKIANLKTKETDSNELARMMVGHEIDFSVEKKEVKSGKDLLRLEDINAYNERNFLSLKNISFKVGEGEILGVAGVEGNGQLELEEIIMGLMNFNSGKIYFKDKDISHYSTSKRRQLGIAHIPSDRLKRGMIEGFNLGENIILGSEWQKPFAENGILNKDRIFKYSDKIIKDFDIRTTGSQSLGSDLSGGNQQKLVLGRELSREPELLVVAQPTRGVDVGAREFIHNLLLEMRSEGKAILLISSELDEITKLSDRILVLYEGEIVANDEADKFTREKLGLLMAGHKGEGNKDEKQSNK